MLNSVNLQGRIASDLQLKATPSGISVLAFSLAVQSNRKNDNGDYVSYFFDCVAWRSTAEFITKHFGKGDMMVLAGELTKRSYTAQDGGKRYITEVLVQEVHFAGKANAARHEEQQPVMHEDYTAGGEAVAPDEQLPF